MAILVHTGMETLPAGTTNVQGIIDSNFAIVDQKFDSHHVIPVATSFAIDPDDGTTQEVNVTGNNVTITGITNPHPGQNTIVVFHNTSNAVRTIQVPAVWEQIGSVVLDCPAGEAIAILIIPGVALTAFATL